MGFGVTSSAPCLAGVFGVCSFLFVTIWVAPENRARELRTRGSTVLTQDSQESQMGRMLTPSTEDQISCISRLTARFESVVPVRMSLVAADTEFFHLGLRHFDARFVLIGVENCLHLRSEERRVGKEC